MPSLRLARCWRGPAGASGSLLRGLLACSLVLTGLLAACAPDEREDQLAALARWQDQRLAPLDSLQALIAGPDAQVRRAALRAAGLIGRTDALPAMIAALDDPSEAVRRQAAFSLGLLGGDLAVAPLTDRLTDRSAGMREAAVRGLAQQVHDGSMLQAISLHDEPRVAEAAWTALRNVAAHASGDSLVTAIRAGLTRPESEVRWRVLRCSELAPDSTLVAQIAPYATDDDVQVRVHALRALGRHQGEAALAAVLRSSEQHRRLRALDLGRIRVAEMRALGNLAGPILAGAVTDQHTSPAGRTASLLHQAAGAADPAVATAALEAMTTIARDIPLPPEAARQESLLPVWRLRLVRSARQRLGDPVPAVRAAAVAALGALRGRGAVDELVTSLDDPDPATGGGALTALMSLVPDHDEVCDWILTLEQRHGRSGSIAVLGAMPTLLASLRDQDALHDPLTRFPRRQDPGCLPSLVWWQAARGLQSSDVAQRTLAAPLLASLRGESSRRVLLSAWQAERTRGEATVQLALLKAIGEHDDPASAAQPAFEPRRRECLFFATGTGSLPARAGGDAPADLVDLQLGADLELEVDPDLDLGRVLTEAFAHPDLRVRLAAHEIAMTTGALPARLIPTPASLRETQPAHRRHPEQPQPGASPPDRVRCVTDHGTFEIRLDPDVAPQTVATFVALIASGFHDELTFHRVVPDFVVQGGCPRGDGWGGPGWTLRSEWSQRPFKRGTVGLAHAGKDSGGSQWFVCLSPQPHLNARYTVFGEVTRGLEVLDRIQRGDRYRLEIIER